uniref:uncharacterized protein At3g17950-like n=1 Tax=Erigeron canadensis TaxID=72917 RepID=UPI001CB98A8B|nr:uncharacterized protein At3g17950-like [Erigeron canadensis]
MTRMSHLATELIPPSLSPTISSVSSSDIDTGSTGSFFHERSTSLGALMGLRMAPLPPITFRTPPNCREVAPTINLRSTLHRSFVGRRRRKMDMAPALGAERRKKRVRRNWWWLCRGEALKPSSLGEFLEFERRFGVDALFSDAMMDLNLDNHHRNGSRVLFANGRVLPPPLVSDVNEGSHCRCSFCRVPVLLAGICGGAR